MNIKQESRSDELVGLRKIFAKHSAFSQFASILQIDIILDANPIISDLIWLVCKAKNPSARTQLMEVIDSETVIAHAPTYLEIEIEKNIYKISKERNISPSKFFSKWEKYKEKIVFTDVGGPQSGAIDPKDVPYIELHKLTGFPVLSEDKHIHQMGAKVLNIQVIASSKSYSRDAVVEYKIKLAGFTSFAISAEMIKFASKLLADVIKKIPPWVWLFIISCFIIALSIESIRKNIKALLVSFSSNAQIHAEKLIKLLEPLINEHNQCKTNADLEKEKALKLKNA